MRFNCAALTEELAEAELFGHAKGAFTGARRERAGPLRARPTAARCFLDEVGELPPPLQAKLLRVLQEGEIRPVGEDAPVQGGRARHRGHAPRLAQLVAEGAFREDLYYRLNVVHLAGAAAARAARGHRRCWPRTSWPASASASTRAR